RGEAIGRACLATLRVLGARDAQAVLRLAGSRRRRSRYGRGADRAGGEVGGLARRGTRGDAARELLAVGVPVLHLRVDLLARIGLGDLRDLFRGRDAQDLAGLQAVHVAAGERVLVLAIERDEHLLEAHVGGLHLARDLREVLALLDGAVSIGRGTRAAGLLHLRLRGGLGSGACGGRGGRRRRGRRRFGRRRLRSGLGLRRRDRRGRGGHRGRCDLGLAITRRVEEDRVFALQLPGGPRHFHERIEERLVDRAHAGDLEIRRSVGALLDGEAQQAQQRGILDAG